MTRAQFNEQLNGLLLRAATPANADMEQILADVKEAVKWLKLKFDYKEPS